jgi:tight adherence protein C
MDGVLIPALVAFLAFVSVIAVGGALLVGRKAGKERMRTRLVTPVTSADTPDTAGTESSLHHMLETVGKTASLGGASQVLRQKLAKAGYHGNAAARFFLGAKVLLLIIGLAGTALLVLPVTAPLPLRLVLIGSGGCLLSFVPNMVVHHRFRRRCRNIREHLPDALDLLEISVSSGMGLDAAWNSVADEIRVVCPALADELALTNLELHLGAPRAVAMRNMADRTDAEEISSLVGALVQSDRFGTSIADTLRTFAGSMRELRSFQAEEAAEKMAVKLLFPMVLFIFPAVLIVAVGPAIIVLADLIGGG